MSSPLVVTFGELMLRLSPPGSERFLQSPVFSATFGGGEANVAVNIAQLGLRSRFVSCLPANPIGDAAIRTLRAEGIDVGSIRRSGSRVGIYYAENGASQRASTVVYDRTHSAISEMLADAIDWSAALDGAAWFHFTGITPALSANAASATAAAITAARAAGARVSVDLNFRRKLWTEARAREVMTPLVRNVDLVMANEEDLQSVLGIEVRGARRDGRAARRPRIRGRRPAGRARILRRARCHHAARKPLGERQWVERAVVGCRRRRASSQPGL